MKEIRLYQIPFTGLKEGKHFYEFKIENTFFLDLGYTDFNDADVQVSMLLNKTATMMELCFKAKGHVNLDCDLSSEAYNEVIDTELNLIVKFGQEFNDESDEILILPHGEFQIAVHQYIYEMIILAVPVKRVHPGVKDGTLESDVLTKIREFEENKNNKEGKIDPRWNKLKSLLTDK